MTVTVNINALDKAGHKELRKAYQTFRGKGTVKQLRSLLVMGPMGTVFFTIAVFGFLIGLGVLFLPIAVIAPFAALSVPFKVRKDNNKWDIFLPADRADDVVVLV